MTILLKPFTEGRIHQMKLMEDKGNYTEVQRKGDGPSRNSSLVKPLTAKENGPARAWLQVVPEHHGKGYKRTGLRFLGTP